LSTKNKCLFFVRDESVFAEIAPSTDVSLCIPHPMLEASSFVMYAELEAANLHLGKVVTNAVLDQ